MLSVTLISSCDVVYTEQKKCTDRVASTLLNKHGLRHSWQLQWYHIIIVMNEANHMFVPYGAREEHVSYQVSLACYEETIQVNSRLL